MMDPNDKAEFAEIMTVTMSLYGRDSSPAIMRVYWAALEAHPMEQVRAAFNAWVQDPQHGTFLPKPADIIRTIQSASGAAQWLSANEAWALAIAAEDERNSVVWTDEVAKAWGVAKPLLDIRDKVAARLAFIPAYERLVAAARAAGKEPVYIASLGEDPMLREAAITKAVSAGLLPPPKPAAALAAPEGYEAKDRRAEMGDRMRRLAEAIRVNGEKHREERAQQREEERQRFEARKAEIVAQAMALDEKKREGDV